MSCHGPGMCAAPPPWCNTLSCYLLRVFIQPVSWKDPKYSTYVCRSRVPIFGLSKITLRAQYILRTCVSYISDPNVILIGELPPMSRRTLAYIHTYSVRGACCGRLPASPKNEKISASILPPQCSECLILPVHITRKIYVCS